MTEAGVDQIQDKEKYHGTKPLLFYSGAKYPLDTLSNFQGCPERVVIDGNEFPSAEHAYQAHKFEESDQRHFEMGGKLAEWEGLSHFYKEEASKEKNTARGKRKWWKERMNEKIGIIAKLPQKNWKKAGLKSPLSKKMSMQDKLSLFKRIQRSKYSRNPALKANLLATGDSYLLEFCKGAKRRELILGQGPERWGGLAEQQPDRRWYVYGDNNMGKILMEVREELRKEAAETTEPAGTEEEVVCSGETTWEERDAELRKHAVEVDMDDRVQDTSCVNLTD